VRNKSVFKRAFNNLLREILALPIGANLGSEPEVSRALKISRTTLRSALEEAKVNGIISIAGRARTIRRHPNQSEFYDSYEIESVSAAVERRFMEYLLRGDLSPGDTINGLGLARKLNVSVAALREYLNRFERFGLVQRQPNTSWIFNGFTEKFAVELFEVRELFELRALTKFVVDLDMGRLRILTDLEQEHRALLAQIDDRFHDFSALDAKFHRTFADSADNRFISQLQELISLIFHYHFQWNKADERDRNATAILEHLEIIAALRSGSRRAVVKACERHMISAHQTLVRSLTAAAVAK
jgi:DNA-binding GntR family transcriptional regulator